MPIWNQKSLSEQHVSMTPGKLKAHTYFGQGNKFQGSSKLLAAPHEQKSMGLPVPLSILPYRTVPVANLKVKIGEGKKKQLH